MTSSDLPRIPATAHATGGRRLAALSTRAPSHTAFPLLLALAWCCWCCGGSEAAVGEGGEGASAQVPPGKDGAAEGVENGDVARDSCGIPLDAPIGPEARQAICKLIESLAPLDPELTSDYHDRHFIANQALVRELMRAETEIGGAALHAYLGYKGDVAAIRRGLLVVGAHAAPEDARELLKTLMLEYAYRGIADRTEAALLLAETSPETYLEEAEVYLRRRGRTTKTMPNDEFLVRGWAIACEQAGRSPVDMMADVATNLAMEPAARYFAAEELGRHPNHPVGEAALRTCLIESTGDGYLRTKAAQALRDSLARERACQIFREVLEREASLNFQHVLIDMINKNCR